MGNKLSFMKFDNCVFFSFQVTNTFYLIMSVTYGLIIICLATKGKLCLRKVLFLILKQ